MAKKIAIELDVTGNVVESTANLKAMKAELKKLDVGTSEFKKLFNDIDDLEDKIKSAKGVSSDFVDSIADAGGPLGMLGTGINKVKVATQSFGSALKATGIGLIVAAIGGLVAAFTQTEGAMKKLDPLIIGLQQILGGIFTALEPLIDSFVELATQALPYVTKGIGIFYSSLMALFTFIKETAGGVGKILKGVFTLDFDSIKEGVTQMGDSFGKTADTFTETMGRFEEGTNKITKKEKENAANAKDIADKALADKMKRMEAQDKLDEAALQKLKAEALALATTEEQKLEIEKAFAKKTYDLKKKDLEDKQMLFKKDSVEYKGYTAELINLETAYISESTGLKDKERELEKQKKEKEIADKKLFFEKDQAILNAQMQDRQRQIDGGNEKELQALDLKLKSGEVLQFEYGEKLYNLRKTQISNGLNQLNLAEQQEKMHYDLLYERGKINKEEYEAKILEIQKTYGDKRMANMKAAGENEFLEASRLAELLVQTKEYEKNAIIQLEQAKIAAVATLGNILSQLAGNNKNLAILGLAVQQGAAIADILTRFFRTKATLIGQKAIYAAMIPNPFTAAIGISGVAATTAGLTANTIGMAAGLAGVGSAVAQGLAAINSKGKESNSSSAGAGAAQPNLGRNYGDGGMINGPLHAGGGVMINAEGGEAVMTRGAVTAFGPLLSALNQAGGGRSFGVGQNQGAAFDQPQMTGPVTQPMIVKTYVVSNELTTEQEKQAKLKALSTL